MLVFSLLQKFHRLIQSLDLHRSILPLVKVVAKAFSIKHISNSFKFTNLHTTATNGLLLSNDFLFG